MENAISIMLSSEEIKRRAKNESGYTQDLVATDVAVYLKLAWRNGYYINPNSSYIPEQWLPIQPLKTYDKKYDFLVD